MTGLDTNVLVRYFVQDDAVQSRRAFEIIDRFTEDEPGFISLVTMIEMVWVLGSTYGQSDQQIAKYIERMLQADTLFVQNEEEVFTAVVALKSGRGSFDDALIGALGKWAGCRSTLTFDKKAARIGGFELV